MADYTFDGQHEYKGMVLEGGMSADAIKRVPGLQAVEGDVLIASYPKTGTTWMEELTWLVCNNGDTARAKTSPLHQRMLFLEHTMGEKLPGLDQLPDRPRPCIMKSHLTMEFFENVLQDGVLKVILVIRNPKDTLVSMYNFYRMNLLLGNFPGSWDEFFELHKAKRLLYGGYFDWYTGWLECQDRPNVLLVKYEDMKNDTVDVIRRVSNFLNKHLDDEVMVTIANHTSFDQMKNNKMTNYSQAPMFNFKMSPFLRKGTVGDWKNYFNEEQSELVDTQYREQLAQSVTLQF